MTSEGARLIPHWTFVTNHGAVLTIIAEKQEITIREVATRLGITEGSVLRIIRDLETSGYLIRKKNGRNNSYELDRTLPLPWHESRAIAVDDLLGVLS